ncbi:MAG: hypothetical protein HGA97_06805 [Chlorobiaceae bacterium]|nr:hypothetical protein [Chlorobiaceae bacterium]
MGTTEDYRIGRVVEGIRRAERVLDNRDARSPGNPEFEKIREKILGFSPVWITMEQAVSVIRQAQIVAVGQRVCRVLHPESPETQSVFLDELAGVMAEAGKAGIVTAEMAEEVLNRQMRHRFIASMVSGRYLELCAVHSPDCIFCKAERVGIRCFDRNTDLPI